MLQPGNRLHVRWSARLLGHMGQFQLDAERLRAATIMDRAAPLLALQSACSLLGELAEREVCQRLFLASDLLFDSLQAADGWRAMYVHWELQLLARLGYGLDLSCCAASGSNDGLIYVSPKSARAVSASAGEPYKGQLLPLPAFILAHEIEHPVSDEDFASGLRLSGYFLEKHLYAPQGRALPDVRLRLAGCRNL